MPSREVVGVLIDEVESEALSVRVQVELKVAVFAHHLGGVEREVERQSQITHSDTDGALVVGSHLRREVKPVLKTFSLDLGSRHVEPSLEYPLGVRPDEVGGVNVAFPVALRQHAVDAAQEGLSLQR